MQASQKGDQTLKELKIVEYKSTRILTTAQSAEFLNTETDRINENFNRNKEHYTVGEDYFLLEGSELKKFKADNPAICGSVSRLNKLYLWTEFGVMLHVKSINTNEAWIAYKIMLRDYFRLVAKEKQSQQEQIFTKDVQARCIANEKLLDVDFWCVVTEMWREAWTLEAFQKELKPSSLPDGSCGTKWRNHLKDINHPLLRKSYQAFLHIPNNKNLFKVWVYPDALLFEFRKWLRVEYAEYYDTKYSPSRLKDNDDEQIEGGE
jgi:hypothetical protein